MDLRFKSLDSVLERIDSLARNKEVALIPGFLSNEFLVPQVHWSLEKIEDIELFFEQASRLGSGVLVLDKVSICNEDIESAILKLDQNGDTADEKRKELANALGESERLGMVRLHFLSTTPAAVFSLEMQTELNSLLFDEQDEDDWDDEDDDVSSISNEELDQASERLARDKKFQSANKNSQKALIAKRFFYSELMENDDFPIYEIIERAKCVYEVEIKPELDLQLADEAQKLMDSGMNKKDIAKKLGISTDKLSKLI